MSAVGEAAESPRRDAPGARRRARREPTARGLARYQWLPLLGSLLLLAVAGCLRIEGSEQVRVPGWGSLPTICSLRRVVGMPCPGCGLTRSFISLAHGRIGAAWNYNPVGLLLFALVAIQIPYRLLQLTRLARGLPELRLGAWSSWSLVVAAIWLLARWPWTW